MKTTLPPLRLMRFIILASCAVMVAKAQIPVRIMPLGDSITEGFVGPGNVTGGYREALHALLTTGSSPGGYTLDYVGTLEYPDAITEGWADGDHEGHGGYFINDIRSNIAVWLKQVPDPDVILLHIGTNDFWTPSSNLAVIQERLRNLLADLSSLRPHAKIIVASLIPRNDIYETIQDQFNESLPAIVAAQVALGRQVSYVDMHAAFGTDLSNDLTGDGVHPQPSGYAKMAAGWVPAITSVISPSGTADAPAIASVEARTDLDHVTVKFSKPILDADAIDTNFSLGGVVSVTAATLDATKRVVTLTTSTQSANTVYTLSVIGPIQDRTVAATSMAPGTTVDFTSRSFVDGSFELDDVAWVKTGVVEVTGTSLASATDGQNLVVFNTADQGPGGSIVQTIPTLANQRYRLSFDMGVYASNSALQSLQVILNEGTVGPALLPSPVYIEMNGVGSPGSPETQWQTNTLVFTATSTQTTLTFQDASSETVSVDLLLDDVRLESLSNLAPVAVDDGDIGAPLFTMVKNSGPSPAINVLGNDSDPDPGDVLTVTAAASQDGTVVINPDGSLGFTPTTDFTGEATISYLISDGEGGTAGATLWVAVSPPGPFGNGSFEDGELIGMGGLEWWTAAGPIPEGVPFGYATDPPHYVPLPENGSRFVVFNGGSNNFGGSISQTFATTIGQRYTIAFDLGICYGSGDKEMTLQAEVAGESSPPGVPRNWVIASTSLPPTIADPKWVAHSFTFVAGSDTTTLTFTDASNGPLAVDVDLLLDNVSLTELSTTNTPPVANDDGTPSPVMVLEDSGASDPIPVLVNDTDVDLTDVLTIIAQSSPNGTVTRSVDDLTLIFTPDPDFNGPTTISYTISDGQGGTASATVYMEVTSVNDPPVALADTYATTVNTDLIVPLPGVLSNDTDDGPPPLTAVIDTPPAHGTIGSLNSDGSFTYTPDSSYTGEDTFTYHAFDGSLSSVEQTVTIYVGSIINGSFEQGAPVDFGTLDGWTVAGPVVGYTTDTVNGYIPLQDNGSRFAVFNPAEDDFSGSISQSFPSVIGKTYQVNFHVGLGGVSAGRTQALMIEVTGTSGSLPATEIIDNNPLQSWDLKTYTFTATGTSTTLTFTDVTGDLTTGLHNFVDLLIDNVSVTELNGTNTPPVANDDGTPLPVTVLENSGASDPIPVLANDADVDESDIITIIAQSSPNGTVTRSVDNLTLIFTPAADFYGSTTISYTISDGQGGTASATVFVEVTLVNDSPVALADTYATTINTVLVVPVPGVLGNDTDDGPPPLTAVIDTFPAHGVISALNPDGSFTYTPGTGFSGMDSFTYHAFDGSLSSIEQTVTINVGSIINGSFEQGAPVDFGSLEGWTVGGNAVGYTTDALNGYVPLPENGERFAVFNAGGNDYGDSISQSFPTIPGKNYQLDFHAGLGGVSAGRTQALMIEVTGTSGSLPTTEIIDNNPLQSWDLKTYTFIATSTSTTLTFTDVTENLTTGVHNFADLLIDNVQVAEIGGGNEDPVAVDDEYASDEDMTLTVTAGSGVLANDLDPDGPALSVSLVNDVASGTLDLLADGSFTYTPVPNASGIVTFSYKVNDTFVDSNVATVTLTIHPVNDAPVAQTDTATTDEDVTLNVAAPGVLGNDTDLEGDALTAVLDTPPATGSLTLNGDGSYEYIPAADANGDVTFSYHAVDATESSAPVTVTLTIHPVNDAPVAQADTATTDEDVTLNVAAPGVLGNDTDLEGDTLTAVLDTPPATGSLTLNSDGSYEYIPTAEFNGDVTFSYHAADATESSAPVTVTLTIHPVNDAPVAQADTATTDEDVTLNIAAPGVLGNDTDLDGDTLAAVLDTPPATGSLTLNSDGSYEYIPAVDANGDVTFSYHAADATESSAPVTVTLTIHPVNDAPVAQADTATTDEDATLNVAAPGVLGNDTDLEGDTLTAVLDTPPATGSLTLNSDGSYEYIPAADANGDVTFSYHAADATELSAPVTVTLTIHPVNDAPVAQADSATTDEDVTLNVAAPGVLGNDTDLDGDTLTAVLDTPPATGRLTLNSDGSYEYIPAADTNGDVTFSYHAADATESSAPVTVTLTIHPVNDAPVAQADTATTDEDVTLNVAAPGVLGNDTDLDEDTLIAILVTGVQHGDLSLNPDGGYSYVPALNYYGQDSFTYKVNDGLVDSNVVSVMITINPVNDPPVADSQAVTVNEDSSLQIALTGSDAENSNLYFSVIGQPLHGVVSLTGSVATYTPNPNFNGEESFDFITFVLSDGGAISAPAIIAITVIPVNDAPSFDEDPITGAGATQGSSYVGTLAGKVTEIDDGDELAYSLVGSGWLQVALDGTLSGTPGNDDVGSNSFTVRVTDLDGAFDLATLNIEVTNVNDAPTFAENPITGASATEDLDYSGTLTGAATDIDAGDTLTYSLVGSGWLVVATDGTLSGKPGNDDVGLNSFTVRVMDLAGAFSETVLNIEVANVNDAPTFAENPITGASATEDLDYSGTLTGAATDIDAGDTLTYSLVGSGWLVVATDGTLSGKPGNDDVGPNSFTVRATDLAGTFSEAVLNIEVANVNDAPTFAGNPITGAAATEDLDYSGTLTGAATDIDAGDTLTYSLVGSGWLVVATDGTLSGKPGNDDVGLNSFTVRVTDLAGAFSETVLNIEVTNVNDAPTFAGNPITGVAATEDLGYSGTLAGSATDIDAGDSLTYSLVGSGWLVVATDGALSGMPSNANVGLNTFTIRVSDLAGAVAESVINIEVINVNDAPTANAGSAIVNEDNFVAITLTGSDMDVGDVLSFVKVTGPTHGTVTITGSIATYTPNPNYNGLDSFTFKANDTMADSLPATISVEIKPIDDAPVANAQSTSVNEDGSVAIRLTGSDIDGDNIFFVPGAPSHGGVTQNGAVVTYTPSPNFNGADSFTFTVYSQPSGIPVYSAPKTVSITVNPVNDPPVALAGSAAVNEDGLVEITLSSSDVDGDPLSYAVGTASHGTVTHVGAVATYTPEANYSGADGFTYTVTDGKSAPVSASVTVIVNPLEEFFQWMDSFGLAANPSLDSDGDTISNGLEFVIGGDPADSPDLGLLPVAGMESADLDGNPGNEDYLVFTYRRTDLARDDPSTTIAVQWSTSLTGLWQDVDGMFEQVIDGEGVDLVKVYIPRSLATGGKLFARLGVDIALPPSE